MLDQKEEQKFEQLKRLGQELHVPIPEVFIKLEVFKDGKLVQKNYQRSHSWVRNAYNLLFTQVAGKNADDDAFEAGKLSGKDTGGNIGHGEHPITIGTDGDAMNYGYRAPSGEDGWGILPGYGDTAESFEDYVLANPVIEGTTDDGHHMSFAESELHAISYAALVLTNTLIRYFNNNEATNSVDVKEVCLAFKTSFPVGTPTYLSARDVLASTVTVPPTGQLKVTYEIQLTYPS